MMEDKQCSNCKETKPINKFPKTGRRCNVCFNILYIRPFMQKNRDRYLKKKNKTNRMWARKNNKDREHYLKSKATGATTAVTKIRMLVIKGKMPQLSKLNIPCVDCGKKATQYEHRDYNKPLVVEPVCQSCNRKRGAGIPLKRKEIAKL